MKTRVRWLIVAVLIAVLTGGGWLLWQGFAARQRADQARAIVDVLPNVAQRIQNFHRVKVDNGRKVWEVSAREAQYLEGQEMVVVDRPVVELFLRDGRSVALRGDGGKVFLKSRELQRVELQGNIEVQLADYDLRTDAAHYEADNGLIVAPGLVHITGAGFELQGERMEVDVAAQRLSLAQQVQTTMWPRS